MSKNQKNTLLRILASAALLALAWLLPLEGLPRLLAFLVPYALIGCDIVFSAVRGILRGRFSTKIS